MNEYLPWNDDYATGIAAIDGDHRTLFMMVNALHDAMMRDEPPEDLPGLFRRLMDYVAGHFQREETLMASTDYPYFEEHRDKHSQLAATLQRMAEEFSGDPEGFPVADLLDFLKNWLSSHVLKSDMEYVPFVTKAG